jgi:hypothetical protein
VSDSLPPHDGSPPRSAAAPVTAEPGDAEPSQALAEVWDLLDALPDAVASPDMMATTMEMAAAPATATLGREGVQAGAWDAVRWLPGAVIVLASLGIGIAAGRSTLPNPETGILTSLPFVQNLDLLREAGSVAFLEELATREYPAPRRLPPAQSPATVLADVEKFDAAVASFRQVEADGDGKEMLAARREKVLALPERERRQLDKSVETFLRLSASDRRELVAVGRALADPSRGPLVDAARLWHQWIQLRDPADRRDVIDLGTAERLEWLDRMARLDERMMEGRDGMRPFYDRDPRRRQPQGPGPGAGGPGPGQQPQGKPEFMPPGPPRPGQPGPPGMQQRPRGPNGPNGQGGPSGQGGPNGPGPRGPEPRAAEPRRPEGEGGDKLPVSRDDPAAPAETPAPPR